VHIKATCTVTNTRITSSGDLQNPKQLWHNQWSHGTVCSLATRRSQSSCDAATVYADLPVRGSDLVLNGSARFRPTPNPEPDRRSGSAPAPNPGPNFGPVREGSGSDQSSEPNGGNPKPHRYIRAFTSMTVLLYPGV